jgi:hypothetical protein
MYGLGLCRRKTRQGKGAKIRAVAEGAGVPIAIPAAPANPNPIPRVEATVEVHFVLVIPTDGSGGGNFSDPNDRRLATQDIEPVIVHRGHQTKRPAQGGRVLRRYSKRLKVERLLAWLHNVLRLVCVASIVSRASAESCTAGARLFVLKGY